MIKTDSLHLHVQPHQGFSLATGRIDDPNHTSKSMSNWRIILNDEFHRMQLGLINIEEKQATNFQECTKICLTLHASLILTFWFF